MSKKLMIILGVVIAIAVIAVVVFALNTNTSKNIEGTLEEIAGKLYEGVAEDDLPMMLRNNVVSTDQLVNYVGTSDIDAKEVLVSESGVGSIAHSVVLIRLNSAAKAQDAVAKIKESANPRKWICVEASNVSVKSKGDLVILIMSNETLAPKIESNFEGLV